MLPAAWVTVASFPLTANGKLDRRALPVPDSASVVTQEYEAPEGETERELAAVWCALLGLERVGRHDNFFELGGHSLMMVSLLERLPQRADAGYPPCICRAGAGRHGPVRHRAGGGGRRHPAVAHSRALPGRHPGDAAAGHAVAVRNRRGGGHGQRGAANVQDIYPLSPLQEGILFHHLLEEEDAYLLYSLLAFDSAAQRAAFLGAFQQVIDRHDILRTAVCREGLSAPVQVVWRQALLPVTEFVPQGAAAVPAQLRAHMDPRRRRIDYAGRRCSGRRRRTMRRSSSGCWRSASIIWSATT